MPVIISDLEKKYGDFNALSGINMEIGNGVFGLLGKNGAGKTTLMRILTTLLDPTSGSVEINGVPVDRKHARQIKEMIGFLPQETGLYPGLNVHEFLTYMALMQELPESVYKKRIEELLERVNLSGERKKKVKNLSGGMKRRLGLAQAMLNHPEILIIDEPTTGLDPEERIRIRNILSHFAKDRIVILSTHIVEDVAAIAHNVGILHEGKLRYIGGLDDLMDKVRDRVYSVELTDIAQSEEYGKKHIIISETYNTGHGLTIRFISDNPEIGYKKETANAEDAFIYTTKAGVSL